MAVIWSSRPRKLWSIMGLSLEERGTGDSMEEIAAVSRDDTGQVPTHTPPQDSPLLLPVPTPLSLLGLGLTAPSSPGSE